MYIIVANIKVFHWNFSLNTNLEILGGLKYLHTNYSLFLYLAPAFQIAFLKTHFFFVAAHLAVVENFRELDFTKKVE